MVKNERGGRSQGVNLIQNLKSILSAARTFGIKIIYVPHHQTEKGDYLDWKFRAPSHEGSLKYSLFEKGSWGGEFHPELLPPFSPINMASIN